MSDILSERPNTHHIIESPPPYTESSSDTVRSPILTPRTSIGSLPSTITSRAASPVPGSKASAVLSYPPPSTEASVRKPLLQLPGDLQRAKAPLHIKQSNSSISGSFLILQDNPHDERHGPDVRLKTSNSSIKTAVYVNDDHWARPVTIEAQTWNSSINLAVYTLRDGQALEIRATTVNGSNNILLPRDYKGLLVLQTTNSKTILSPDLQKVSVHISKPDELNEEDKVGDASSKASVFRIDVDWDSELTIYADKDKDSLKEGLAKFYEINGGSGPSRAFVTTKYSKVTAGFVGSAKAGAGTTFMSSSWRESLF